MLPGMVRRSVLPVIVGTAQVVQRPGELPLGQARGPIELMIEAVQAAADDAGAPSLLGRVGYIGVAGGWFKYRNPGQLVAERIGSPGAATALTGVSGSGPQDMLGIAAERIAAGQLDVAVIVGGEARWSHQKISRGGGTPHWIVDEGDGEPEMVATFPDSQREEGRRLGSAAAGYALFEDSLRASRGTSLHEHRVHISELWARFSNVAATNPYAWDRVPHSAEQIRNATDANRMITFPYTKAMVANNTVDMSSAVILCSTDLARELNISDDRLVFPHIVTVSRETWMIGERHQLHATPALATAGRVAFERTGLSPAAIEHVELYACFPSIVQMSSEALGLDPDRELTVTGGLGFAGAPIGNAAGHSIAAMVERVRNGGRGMVHANGGHATKHAIGIYATTPPDHFERVDVQDDVVHHERLAITDGWSGPVVVEAATVVYGREGPTHVLAAVLDGHGARAFVTSTDADAITETLTTGISGHHATRTADDLLRL
jgi:acetyl-CoA C-acetyltransferase